MVEAALGATVSVETLDGPQELEFPAGTQPGEERVLRGKGMPVVQGSGRGDHRVLVNVSVPRRLSAEQRELLTEFEAGSDEHTYRHDPSFFDRLKSAFH
jgi:molecular chaperone DnaJ